MGPHMERLRADIALGRESVYRDTRCTLSDAVVWERTWDAVQETIERAIPVQQYDSDAVAAPLATPPAAL